MTAHTGPDSAFWQAAVNDIGERLDRSLVIEGVEAVSGGCISPAYRVRTDGATVFIKTGDEDSRDRFDAELAGLQELEDTGVIGVPQPLCTGSIDSTVFIAMEAIETGSPTAASFRLLGSQLAALHRVTGSVHGWFRDNYIGLTPQRNDCHDSWLEFFRDQRLEWQFRLARDNGFGQGLQDVGKRLLDNLDVFFVGYDAPPSLLHGDLWSGNQLVDRTGRPYIVDPAVYYGDRESDMAMTELFGGFPPDFYAGYAATWPLDAGYGLRKPLYQLYHLLNHANLFGGSYVGQAAAVAHNLVAERT